MGEHKDWGGTKCKNNSEAYLREFDEKRQKNDMFERCFGYFIMTR